MVGVADVDPERQAEQLAAEMILEAGADDFLAVIEIFRTDEADHAVDEQRIEGARHRIGPRFAGLLVDVVMRIGRQRRALPGLEILTLLPTVPRRSDSPASRASRNSARSTPKLRLAASVPAIDWNTRSTGAPCPINPSVVVT